MRRRIASLALAQVCAFGIVEAQRPDTVVAVGQDSLRVRLVDVDVRAAVQLLAAYLDRPIIVGPVNPVRVTIETPTAVPRGQVVGLLRALLESHHLELVVDSSAYVVRNRVSATSGAARVASSGSQDSSMVELFVIRLRHARAPEVAATVSALFGQGGALGEPGERPSSLSDQLRQNLVPPVGSAPPQAVSAVAGKAATLSAQATIIPDPHANSLLIRASRQDFELISAAVSQIDVRPLQVLIEVMITEIRKDRSIAFGVDASVPEQGLPGTTSRIEGSSTGAGLGDFVLRLMSVGSVDLDATLRAAASRGDVRIVSRPVVVTANNERAEIMVGSQRPFVQVSRTLPTDSPLRDQIVQYKDVGTKLVVLPTISEDGYVMLEVLQENNAATTETQFDAPVISTRTVQTRLLIKDGQTAAIGGLNDRQRDVSQSGIPFLSAIPILGGLFGRASRRTTETELFLFLTPHVIRSDEDIERLSGPLREKARKIRP